MIYYIHIHNPFIHMRFLSISIISLSLFVFLVVGQAWAQDISSDGGAEPAVSEEDTISLQDLEAGDPKILPASPFYFLKELTRGVQRIFTFDSIGKAELELQITNEKAAEVKKTQDTQGQNSEALQEAVENYQKAQEALKVRFELLKETSQNPNIDKLLDKFTGHIVKHEKLFDEIAVKTDKEEVRASIKMAKESAEEATGAAIKKDDVAKFVARLEKALVEGEGSELKSIRSLEIIDRITQKAPDEVKGSLERLREGFSSMVHEDIALVLDKGNAETLKKALDRLPGDPVRRSILLEELQSNAQGKSVAILKEVSQKLEDFTKGDQENIFQKAEEQIKNAEKFLAKLDSAIGEKEVSRAVHVLRESAREHLKEAKAAFDIQKYGEAFGQARASEVASRNALSKIEDQKTPDASTLQQYIDELAAKILRYEQILTKIEVNPESTMPTESRVKARSLLVQAKEHLGYAKDAYSKEDLVTAKTHIQHVAGYLSDLARLIQGNPTAYPMIIKRIPSQENVPGESPSEETTPTRPQNDSVPGKTPAIESIPTQ